MLRLDTVEQATAWLRSQVGSGTLQSDSRRIQAGDAFIAWPGAATDGRQYVASALSSGASCCLVEAEGAEAFDLSNTCVAQVSNLKAASGLIAAEYFAQPSHSLEVVAVTGTNGKTSSAWWLAQAINHLRRNEDLDNYACGLIGTLGVGTPGDMVATGLTTPDPVMLQAELARLRDTGASACAIEASSIGLAEHRMAGTRVSIAIFTNFTQDHLDYHRTMDEYWLAKRALFDMPGLAVAVINLDDPKGAELVAYCKQRGLQVFTTSQIRTDATLCGSSLLHEANGMAFNVAYAGQRHRVTCPVIGDYNAANMLGVIGALLAMRVDLRDGCEALSHCTPVPGRMDLVTHTGQPLMVVDYAHTPDALTKALAALRPTAQARGGKIWCVFGCGGNRDPLKRPLMAKAAQAGAEQIVLTSDNPRHESQQVIAEQVVAGFTGRASGDAKVRTQLDRRLAIQYAGLHAAREDVILIAGKGHEDYQEVAGVRYPFSDLHQAKAAIELRISGEIA